MVKLKYVAEDGRYYPGVPASDHDQADDGLAEKLVRSGLYEFADRKRQAAAVRAREKQLAEEEAAEAAEREAVASEGLEVESTESAEVSEGAGDGEDAPEGDGTPTSGEES